MPFLLLLLLLLLFLLLLLLLLLLLFLLLPLFYRYHSTIPSEAEGRLKMVAPMIRHILDNRGIM
ncbi:MAG: hypothetical protein EHM48_04170 [Planctomycetaceae bacterium]|nr:MAG: hypothetical protein EHM48_04170 [Planctomycetaceae bacterium]